MESADFAKKVLKLLERIAKSLEKLSKDEEDATERQIRGFNPGGTD